MTAHIVVRAIDSAPATLSRPHLTGLLREELGFTGMIITDALEMQAISATVGMEEGAVLALAAGADALCLGHDIDAGHVARVRDAIVRAVRDGRISEELLAAAGARVCGSGAALGAQAETLAAETLAEVGLEAARRAVRCEGTVTAAGPLAVVELGTPPSVAAGTAAHDLASVLTERGADVVALRLDGFGPELAAVGTAHPGRRLVIVVRDADRHPWARTAAETLVAGSSGAVIVDVGYPGRPVGPPGTSRVATFGAARASYAAAAECILG
jgi:beta-N-acetylhexosaminidase